MKGKRGKQDWANEEVELQYKDDKFLINLVGSPGVSIDCQNNPYLSVTGCELPGKGVTSSQAALRS